MDRGKGKCRAATQDREQHQWSGGDTDESMELERAEVGQDSSHELAVRRERTTRRHTESRGQEPEQDRRLKTRRHTESRGEEPERGGRQNTTSIRSDNDHKLETLKRKLEFI